MLSYSTYEVPKIMQPLFNVDLSEIYYSLHICIHIFMFNTLRGRYVAFVTIIADLSLFLYILSYTLRTNTPVTKTDITFGQNRII